MTAAEITELMPGAGPPPTTIASVPEEPMSRPPVRFHTTRCPLADCYTVSSASGSGAASRRARPSKGGYPNGAVGRDQSCQEGSGAGGSRWTERDCRSDQGADITASHRRYRGVRDAPLPRAPGWPRRWPGALCTSTPLTQTLTDSSTPAVRTCSSRPAPRKGRSRSTRLPLAHADAAHLEEFHRYTDFVISPCDADPNLALVACAIMPAFGGGGIAFGASGRLYVALFA